MSAREATAVRLTHRFASEVHRALADANMTIADLASQIGESPAFLRRVLVGENGTARSIRLSLIADISWATGQWISISITQPSDVEPGATVETGEV